jgi:uncharacterized protein
MDENANSEHNGPRNNRLIPFFLLTFAWSWLFWLPTVLISNGVSLPNALQALGMLSVFGPAVAAITLTAKDEGKHGV